MTKFMNIYWFREVTHQDQGIEIFDLMRKAFNIEPMYQQVKDEIERADELIELIHNEKVEKFNAKAGLIGMIIGLLAVLTGYFGMNFAQIADPHKFNVDWITWLTTTLLITGFIAIPTILVEGLSKITMTMTMIIFFLFLFLMLLIGTLFFPFLHDFFLPTL